MGVLAPGVPFAEDVSYPGINQIPHTALGNPTASEQQYEDENNWKYSYDSRSPFFRHVDSGSNCTCHENKACENSERIN